MQKWAQEIFIGIAFCLSACATLNRESTVRLQNKTQVLSSCFERTHSDTFKAKVSEGTSVKVRFIGSADYAFLGPVVVPIIPTRLPFSSKQRVGFSLHFDSLSLESNLPREFDLSRIRMIFGDRSYEPSGFYHRRWGDPLSSTIIEPTTEADVYVEFELPKGNNPTPITLILGVSQIVLEISRSWLYTPLIMGDNTRSFSHCEM